METTVKERLIEYLKCKGISKTEFGERIGVSNAYVTSIRKSIQPDKLQAIALNYPDLNTSWLLTGEGEMLNSTEVGVFQRGSPPGYVSLPKEVYEQMLQTIKSQQDVIELLGDVIKKTNARMDTNAECAAAAG